MIEIVATIIIMFNYVLIIDIIMMQAEMINKGIKIQFYEDAIVEIAKIAFMMDE